MADRGKITDLQSDVAVEFAELDPNISYEIWCTARRATLSFGARNPRVGDQWRLGQVGQEAISLTRQVRSQAIGLGAGQDASLKGCGFTSR